MLVRAPDLYRRRRQRSSEKAERDGGLDAADAARFVAETAGNIPLARSRPSSAPACITRLHDAHRLIADVVSFKGPHINHLTPRTLDIDAVQARMPDYRASRPKADDRRPADPQPAPILLRQTSFKALEEAGLLHRPQTAAGTRARTRPASARSSSAAWR